jgi:hypothetical protein
LKDSHKKVILLHPNAKEIIHTYFDNFQKNLCPIEQYFGNKAYKKVNEGIKKVLSKI